MEQMLGAWGRSVQPFATSYFPGHSLSSPLPCCCPRLLPRPLPGRDWGVGTEGVGFGVSPTYQVMGGACENMHCSTSTLLFYNIK